MPQPVVQPRPAKAAPQTPAAPGQTLPATDLATMQSQLADVRIQHAGLDAQWNALQRQLNSMRQDNPARPGVQQQWADVGIKRAQVEGDIAALQARIAQKQGIPGAGTQQFPGNFPGRRNAPDPDMVIGMTMGLLMVIAIPLSIAYARRIWKGKPQPVAPRADDFSLRFDRLEQAVDAIAIEVERISEGQRFVTKIMAERPAQSAQSVNAPDGSQAEEKPILALGAGAVEPIRVGDRQAVRQGRPQ